MQDIKDKLIGLKSGLDIKIKRRNELSSLIFSAKEEKEKYEKNIELDTKALVVVQNIYEKLNELGLKEVCRLMTSGLSQIYTNRNYEVCHEITMERGANQLNFYLKEVREDGKIIKSNIRNSSGGSIRAVTGLIGSFFYILKLGGKRFLGIDENLSQIEDSVVEDLFRMMKSFCMQAGFMILLVTHDVRFLPYADRIYMVKNGKIQEVKK